MGHRANPGSKSRAFGFAADNQNRERIAQVAARLILEHGITDWSLAISSGVAAPAPRPIVR
jgi:hypothetical protein